MILFNCKEFARRSTSGEFDGASWPTRIVIRMHMAMCRHCRRYGRQLKRVSEAIREKAKASASSKKINRLKAKVLGRLDRQP